MAANKSDLFSKEQVTEEEGKQYAQEIGAIFQITSACTGIGVNELFFNIGKRLFEPNKVTQNIKKEGIKIKKNNKKKKKKCC